MAAKLYNLARMSTSTTGTGTITLGSAATGFLSFAGAGVQDGDIVTYAIKDGSNSEIGRGLYTSSGTSLTRSVLKSTNSDSAINLSGTAEVFITAAAEDISGLSWVGINVLEYGATGDGSTDDTAAIQDAIDYLETLPRGGVLFFPAGTYKTSSTLTVANHYITLEGEGNNCASIVRAAGFTTGYTVDFSRGGATDSIFWGGIKNLRMVSTDAMTSHGHIRLNVARLFELDNLYLEDGFVGIHCVSVGDLIVSNSSIVTGTDYPTSSEAFAYIYFDTDTSATIPRNGACLENLNLRSKDDDDGHCLHGIYISSADGIWADSVHIGNCNSACLTIIPKDGTTQLSGLMFDNCWFDQGGTGRGVNCTGTTSETFGWFKFTDCTVLGGNDITVAFRFAPSAATLLHVYIDDAQIGNVSSSAIQFANTKDFAVRNSVIRNPGSGGGSVHGIHVTSGCSDYIISGNQIGYNADLSGNALTGYGIVLTGSGLICEGNDCRGNATGGILDNGTTGSRIIRGNLGASGSGTIASASTITLPADGELFTISGTTTITSVTASWPGRRVTFKFSGALTFTDGSNLKLAGNYTTTADDTISLICDGTDWLETSRSGNI